MIDLHTHSRASDGSMKPRELVAHAKAAGLEAMAITDHDTADGVAEALAAGREYGIEVVPGIELSVISDTETHILGYYIDPSSPALTEALVEIQRCRVQRGHDTAELLQAAGFDITFEDGVAEAGEGQIARAHYAVAMVKKGYVASVKEAFDKYLGTGCVAHSSLQPFTAAEAVRLIRAAGGVPVVAHLHLIKKPLDWLYSFIGSLVPEGLAGVEGMYTEYTSLMQEDYGELARKFGLVRSGGTDFHGAMKPHISIGSGLGNLSIPYRWLEDIKRAAGMDIAGKDKADND